MLVPSPNRGVHLNGCNLRILPFELVHKGPLSEVR